MATDGDRSVHLWVQPTTKPGLKVGVPSARFHPVQRGEHREDAVVQSSSRARLGQNWGLNMSVWRRKMPSFRTGLEQDSAVEPRRERERSELGRPPSVFAGRGSVLGLLGRLVKLVAIWGLTRRLWDLREVLAVFLDEGGPARR